MSFPKRKNPEESATFLSKTILWWLNPLVLLGAKRDLRVEDVYPLEPSQTSEQLMKKWKVEWMETEKKAAEDDVEPSIVWTFFRIYRLGFFSLLTIRIFSDVIQFLNPLLLKYLIDFISDSSSPLYIGILLSIAMFLCSDIRSLSMCYFTNELSKYTVATQSILMNTVFEKTLRLSTECRNDRSIGQIVNLMSIDVDKMVSTLPVIHLFVSGPLQIIVAMIMLWFTLGVSSFGGMLIMISFIPINFYSSKFIRKQQQKQMRMKDERTKMCKEVLTNMKMIKLYAWEESFEKKINDIRKEEIGLLRKAAFMTRTVDAANSAAPVLVAAVSFATFVYLSEDNSLTPQIAFVSLALFNQIRQPLRMFAVVINNWVQGSVSNDRLRSFLSSDENQSIDYHMSGNEAAVEMEDMCLNWSGPSSLPSLSSLSFSVPSHSLVSVVGGVGSGKSSLLAAIIGEMHHLSGKMRLNGTIAYVPQQPWLQTKTIRENITFGKEYDREWYGKVTNSCELTLDFSLFPHGDFTEVGENGITLSGGQKARLSLARSIYQNLDVYLLDDVLSAVDSNVGESVFEKVIGPRGILSGKTRMFVTHGLQYTKESDEIFVMNDGEMVERGKYNDLQNKGMFKKLLHKFEKEKEEAKEANESEEELPTEQILVVEKNNEKETQTENDTASDRTLIKKERMETGRVALSVYRLLIHSASLRLSLLFILFLVSHHLFGSIRSIWLAKWVDETKTGHDTMGVFDRLLIYTSFGIVEVISVVFSLYSLVLAASTASLRLHSPFLHALFRSPMAFFDTTPIGRILNRCSRDFSVLDSTLPQNISQFSMQAFSAFTVLLMITYSTPIFIVFLIPLVIAYVMLLRFFLPSARQLKRLDNVQRSPVLAEFTESIVGGSTIRAYHKVETACESFSHTVDNCVQMNYIAMAGKRWLSVRLELLGNTTVLFSALLGVLATRYATITPGLVALSVSYALTITSQLNLTVRSLSDIETNIVSVERIKEYTDNEEEDDWSSASTPPSNWPESGVIEWKDYGVRYRKGLPLVLKNLSFSIRNGEKIGVVGRTGSGKSSLTMGLFRLLEPSSGRIWIDNLDISTIGLHDLRRKITIIPQEPVLFSGTIRFNLDPFETKTDDELWRILESCQMKEFVRSQGEGLEYTVSENGKNMSVGQRQLLCLCRAIIRGGNILILDEATSSVDSITDTVIQRVIKEKFGEATVIAIAHRLDTVENYDRILILERGEMVEMDTPQSLLLNKKSRYSQMLQKNK